MNISTVIGTVIGTLVAAVFLSFLLSWPIMWLWNNALVGAVVGVNEIGWLQAWGINILCSCLFKSSVTNKTEK